MPRPDTLSVPAGAPRRSLVVAAFAAIYLIWGSTYLAIRYAVESVPPFLMTGVRFLVAGAVLYAWAAWRGRRRGDAPAAVDPGGSLRAWRDASVVGALLIVGGTAAVAWAERSVPSGITSLVLATTPLWMVLLESAGPRGRAPTPRVIGGVAIGLAGLTVLIWPSLVSPTGSLDLLGIAVLVVSALAWSIGALHSRRIARPGSAARSTGMQMLAGAALSLAIALLLGEQRELARVPVSAISLLAIGYLIVAGALVGFSAYLWLMRVAAPSRVATHAYVNPVVAVVLGWAVAGEPVTARTGVAMAVIVAAVGVIVMAPTARTHVDTGRPRAIIPAWRVRRKKAA